MSYEGGPDTYGSNVEQAKNDLNFDPRREIISSTYHTRWFQNGKGTFHWYVIGTGGSSWIGHYGTWSLLHWLSDSTIVLYSAPSETHRLHSLLNSQAAGTYGINLRTRGEGKLRHPAQKR